MFYSYTYFRVKAWWALPLFQWHALFSHVQARRTQGLHDMNVWPEKGKVFCTLTSWTSEDDMLRFRNKGSHRKAMKHSRKMGEGYAISFESTSIPSRDLCKLKLMESMGHGLDMSALIA